MLILKFPLTRYFVLLLPAGLVLLSVTMFTPRSMNLWIGFCPASAGVELTSRGQNMFQTIHHHLFTLPTTCWSSSPHPSLSSKWPPSLSKEMPGNSWAHIFLHLWANHDQTCGRNREHTSTGLELWSRVSVCVWWQCKMEGFIEPPFQGLTRWSTMQRFSRTVCAAEVSMLCCGTKNKILGFAEGTLEWNSFHEGESLFWGKLQLFFSYFDSFFAKNIGK